MKNLTKSTGTRCLVATGGVGSKFACGTIKAGVTTACVTGGFIGGSYIGNFVEDRTGNPILGIIAKYATVATSAVVANSINNKIESAFNPVKPMLIEMPSDVLEVEVFDNDDEAAELFDVVDEDAEEVR